MYLFFFVVVASALRPPPLAERRGTRLYGKMVEVKFRIHADGRVEETVMGIKGSDCVKVTEGLNEKLGEVVRTQPTEDMFEEKVVETETVQATVYEAKFSQW